MTQPAGWLLAGLALCSCVSGSQIRASSEILKIELERARRAGALRCAPQELATGEANLEFALGELDEGASTRASEHLRESERATRRALELTRVCAPLTPGPKLVVKIDETDRDGDTVIDAKDRCPDVPGPVENGGCPLEQSKDRDGDGVPDSVDRCVDQPEDKDGFQDDDGCPEPDNDNDGLLDGADKCPLEAGPIQNLGCPVLDKDGDGINDDVDRCPNEAEDKDGYQDDDGCPDLDNDNDGVPDVSDGCINEPGPADNKGCPRAYSLVTVTKERIEIKKQIKFATGSAKIIGAESQAVLDQVAQALRDTPSIKKVRIEGHTDSVGPDAANLRLSQKRADAVMAQLLRFKVDPSRMEAVGFGETKPLASNATAAGKAENRRTEFNILEQ